MAKALAGVHIANVHFNDRNTRALDRIVKRDGSVREGTRVQHHTKQVACLLSAPRLMNRVDQNTFMVGLATVTGMAELLRSGLAKCVNLRQGRGSVDLGFSLTEKIQIWAMKDEDGRHAIALDCPGHAIVHGPVACQLEGFPKEIMRQFIPTEVTDASR